MKQIIYNGSNKKYIALICNYLDGHKIDGPDMNKTMIASLLQHRGTLSNEFIDDILYNSCASISILFLK